MTDDHEKKAALPSARVADADREVAASRLQDASAEGRLDLIELEERLTAVFASKTRGELDALFADLPAERHADQAVAAEPLALRTKSGTLKKTGYWNVPSRITAECTSGTIRLDFTQARCPHREIAVDVSVRSGTVLLIVPKGWGVNVDQASATSGYITNKVGELAEPGCPVLRIKGKVLSGVIKARFPRRSFRDWLLGKPR